MAFANKRRSRIARKFGISEDNLMRAAARINGYIGRHGCETAVIADALRFLIDTIEEVEAKTEKKEFSYHFQTVKYRKWEPEIIKLYQKDYGAKRISDAIVSKKGPRIPKSSIERFLKRNSIKRHSNG
ncbi:MAG: hypothetical protein DSY46_02945 [Hydrogenimonas sp.]|nr:MAG: hypothetical protein DSY46_02945 [Hydrogenimonas sp.]